MWPSYLGLEIVGVVVGVVGVHWLLLQTFSHVAGIQLKVLEAGDRSSQVGYDRSKGLAWILQTTGSKSRGCGERTLSSYWRECVMNAEREGWIGGQIVLGISVCLLVWELTGNLTKPFLPQGWEKRQRESGGAAEKGVWGDGGGGWGKEDMKG